MQDVFSATDADATGGSAAMSRACCAEFAGPRPSPQMVMLTAASASEPTLADQATSPTATAMRQIVHASGAPSRPIATVEIVAPMTPATPNKARSVAITFVVAPKLFSSAATNGYSVNCPASAKP